MWGERPLGVMRFMSVIAHLQALNAGLALAHR